MKECGLYIFVLTLAIYIYKLFRWTPCFSVVPISHSLCSSCDFLIRSQDTPLSSILPALTPSTVLPLSGSFSHFPLTSPHIHVTWLVVTYSSRLLKNISSWRRSPSHHSHSPSVVRFSWYSFPRYLIPPHGTWHTYNY